MSHFNKLHNEAVENWVRALEHHSTYDKAGIPNEEAQIELDKAANFLDGVNAAYLALALDGLEENV